jgi:hypothetical protein
MRPCDRRDARLYLPPGEGEFLCRNCHDLRYLSQRVGADELLDRRALAIRRRLGQKELGQPFPPRPRGMHTKTYERLRSEYMVLNITSVYLTLKRFGFIDPCMPAPPDGGRA